MTVTLPRPDDLVREIPATFEPVKLGPTWQVDPDGDFVLPEHTLGWDVIAWCADNLIGADGEGAWTFTFEQARFILWYYAIDTKGRWLYRDAILQRVKGWGKDPLAAVLCAVELVGPCRFLHWVDADGKPLRRYQDGAEPRTRSQSRAWIQIVGTARDQTKNTSTMLQGLFTKEAISKYGIEIFKEVIYAENNTRRIEVVTSSPRTLEGNRPSFVVKGETHHWIQANDGMELDAVIRRNVNKMRKSLGARSFTVTNAYNPSEGSVGQIQREAYEEEQARGRGRVLYDSLEAPEEVPLVPAYTRTEQRPEGEMGIVDYDEFDQPIPPSLEVIRHHLTLVLERVRGDADWLDIEETIEEILDPQSKPSEMRRFYMNSVITGDEAYVSDGDLRATVHPLVAAWRASGERSEMDILRLGWDVVEADEPIVMFFDGSKSQDSTAVVGCRISDGYFFLVGLWEKPKGKQTHRWLAPREAINSRIHEAFERFNIVAFWADPSHTKDDEDGTRYWDALIDKWHVAYHERLQYWAVQGGDRRSAIMWDMTDAAKQRTFSEEVVRFADEADQRSIVWDGHPSLRIHLRNARRAWGGVGGLSIRKPSRNSTKKIDAAVCAIGAKMLARLVEIKGLEEPEKPAGKIWLPTRRGR